MTEQAASHKIKEAIRYTIGAKVPHYDFFFNPADVHNVTTSHFNDHFQAHDLSPNFTVNYENADTLAASITRFLAHENYSAITPDLKELLWTAITRPQNKLLDTNYGTPLRDTPTTKYQSRHTLFQSIR